MNLETWQIIKQIGYPLSIGIFGGIIVQYSRKWMDYLIPDMSKHAQGAKMVFYKILFVVPVAVLVFLFFKELDKTEPLTRDSIVILVIYAFAPAYYLVSFVVLNLVLDRNAIYNELIEQKKTNSKLFLHTIEVFKGISKIHDGNTQNINILNSIQENLFQIQIEANKMKEEGVKSIEDKKWTSKS
jgi:hypothetical protein